MTIKVERDALLRVLARQPHQPPSSPSSSTSPVTLETPIPNSDEFLLVEWRKPICGDEFSVEKLRPATCDDDDSIFTLSTASISDTDSDLEDRRVSFADEVVTDVWTRPYTPKEEVSDLFYSTEETQRFRQEYRLERKLLSELSVDPETFPVDEEELSALVSTSTSLPCARHRISRVVVLHNDKLETFFNPDEQAAIPHPKDVPDGDDFFDNDSFWSGSITWY